MNTFLRVSLLAVFACASILANAQSSNFHGNKSVTPRVIHFSGTIQDQVARRSGSATVVFSLYDFETSTTPLWTEVQALRIDAAGKYSVLLGSNSAAGVPQSFFSSGEVRWVGMAIEGREQPRIQIVSVPYALKASEADTLNGMTAAEIASQAAAMATSKSQDSNSATSAKSTPAVNQSSSLINQVVPISPATNFSDSTADQVVSVTQNGTGAALKATTASSSNAISGINTATTGTTRSVYGETKSTGSSSAGVYGLASGTTGTIYGVLGITNSTSGTALNGTATAATGSTIGLRGQANSSSGIALVGAEASTTGYTAGIDAFVSSPDGVAAIFDNRAGGQILSLDKNGVEEFSVDGNGNTVAAGGITAASFVGNGSGLTNIASATNASNLTTPLAGDVTGLQGATTVVKLQNQPVSNAAPGSGNVLGWSGSQWRPQATPLPVTPFGGAIGSIPPTGGFIFVGSRITVAVAQNQRITVTGTVSLGASSTAYNVGVGSCYRDISNSTVLILGGGNAYTNVDVIPTKIATPVFGTQIFLAAGSYEVGACLWNNSANTLNSNDYATGLVMVTY